MVKIGLDAGHGLKTSGKQTPDGIKEWTLNDKVRDKIAAYLKPYNVEIINCDNDEGNVDESLTARKNMYINAKVDVFVSIHHNAYNGTWNNVTGVEVYTDKNNTANDTKLANAIYKNLPNYTGLKGRGIKKANFTVINQNKIPAVLVEGGFMDSTIDYPIITSNQGQDGYARAVAEGIIEYLGLENKNVPHTTNQDNTTVSSVSTNYAVKIKSDDGFLNVRENPSANSKIVTTVKNGEVYTIVAENNGWGKLKSGAGWISLKYTDRNTNSYYPACDKSHVSITKALKSICVDSSYENRKKIAQKNNVRNYTGTADQNNQLLSKLKAGRLIKL